MLHEIVPLLVGLWDGHHAYVFVTLRQKPTFLRSDLIRDRTSVAIDLGTMRVPSSAYHAFRVIGGIFLKLSGLLGAMPG